MYDARCAHCGYDLVGLAPEGVCPECGRAFDKRMRRNIGGQGDTATGGTHRPLAAGLAGLALLCAGTGGGVALASADPLQPLAWGLAVGGAMLVASLFVLTR